MNCNKLPTVDEFIEALAIDEPACHYRCRIAARPSQRCMCTSPEMPAPLVGFWACSLPKGHKGRHIACGAHGGDGFDHARAIWEEGETNA